jgi:quinohemoprotein ethanol dehydrogenase
MPMPITISYDVTVRDGELVGDNANGPFGTFPVTGIKP